MIKNYTLLLMCLFLTACAGKPLGKFDSESFDSGKRIVFGRVNFSNQNKDMSASICFVGVDKKENCGTLLTQSQYIRYEDEKPYYNYVIIALPPGSAKISKVKVSQGNSWTDYKIQKGLDFTVSGSKQATYFGDIKLFTWDDTGTQSIIKDNARETLNYIKSANPNFPVSNNYAVDVVTPLESYARQITTQTMVFIPK